MYPIARFVAELRARNPGIRSVWVVGGGLKSKTSGAGPDWELLAFADAASLQRVRAATHLHRKDVQLRIVTGGDRFEVAWGDPSGAGSLFQWEWMQTSESEAYYSQARWRGPGQTGPVDRTRHKARCLSSR